MTPGSRFKYFGWLSAKNRPSILYFIALFFIVFVYFIVSFAVGRDPSLQQPITGISAKTVSGSIEVQMPCHKHGLIVFGNQCLNIIESEFLVAEYWNLRIQANGHSGRNDIPYRGVEFLLTLIGKPMVGLFQSIWTNQYCGIGPNLQCWRPSVVNHRYSCFQRSASFRSLWRDVGNQEWSLLSIKTPFIFAQGFIGDHRQSDRSIGLFGNLGNKLVSLFSIPSHLNQLPVHGVPLKSSNNSADNSSNSDYKSQHSLKSLISFNPLLKSIYLLCQSALAVSLGTSGLGYFDDNRRNRCLGIALLFMTFAICFHIAWVLVYWWG